MTAPEMTLAETEDAYDYAVRFCADPTEAEMDRMAADHEADVRREARSLPVPPDEAAERPDGACDVEYPIRKRVAMGE